MRHLLTFILIATFSKGFAQNTPLPSVDIKTLDGKTVRASSLSNDGKPIIVFLWEVTCKPCITEFDNISKKYADWQNDTGVKIVAVSVDDNKNYHRVNPLVKSKGWKFDFYQDKNQDLKRALGASFCPYTFVVDSTGSVVWRKGGYIQGDEELLYQLIQKLNNGEKLE